MRFSRTQHGTQQGYSEGISGLSKKRLDQRKCLTDAVLEVARQAVINGDFLLITDVEEEGGSQPKPWRRLVPGDGIEPSTHGFIDLLQ